MTAVPAFGRPLVDDGLALVQPRRLIEQAPHLWFPLRPGDRAIVEPGESVLAGSPLAELLIDQRLVEVTPERGVPMVRPGDRWAGAAGGRRAIAGRRPASGTGELLFEIGGRWRVATGEGGGLLEAPAAGIVREVRPGIGIGLQVAGSAIVGVRSVGAPARGRLEIAATREGELRPAGLDVGRAGSILVVGSRADAETLTRARAMGIRGIIVAALASKDLRDFSASEARQRASLHRLPPFAVLVVDGALRRPIPSPLMTLFGALAGVEVAISGEPPLLLFDPTGLALPRTSRDRVRVRQGPMAGREGTWVGPAGLRRFKAGVRLEAGFVSFDDGSGTVPAAIPLADLERFV